MSNAGDARTDARRERWMTVAVVHQHAAHATVRFLESARIYRLPRKSPDYASSLRSLQTAAGTGAAVWVRLTAPDGDVIVSVRQGAKQ
jgi:hypothetical protein